MLESVRLGLRCLMGGNWGADYNDSTGDDPSRSTIKTKSRRSKESSIAGSVSKISKAYGGKSKARQMAVPSVQTQDSPEVSINGTENKIICS